MLQRWALASRRSQLLQLASRAGSATSGSEAARDLWNTLEARRTSSYCSLPAGAGTAPGPSLAAPPLEAWQHACGPIESAGTPPSSWYTDPAVLRLEEQTVFRHSWLAVCHTSQLAAPGAYVAGSLLGLQWLACRDEAGQLHAFHNVGAHALLSALCCIDLPEGLAPVAPAAMFGTFNWGASYPKATACLQMHCTACTA